MTDLELIAVFAGSWIVAAAIWMLLDWAARPKHARFRPKGDRIHRGVFSYRHFRKVRRAEENEEVRLRLEQRYGRPTLALRSKRQTRVLARHDRHVSGIGRGTITAQNPGSSDLTPALAGGLAMPTAASDTANSDTDNSGDTAAPLTEPVYWNELRDRAMGFDGENQERLANGEAPVRYNPVFHEDETMTYDGTTSAWPSHTVDPFEGFTADALSEDGLPETGTADDESTSSPESDSAMERAVRDLEHLPEAG